MKRKTPIYDERAFEDFVAHVAAESDTKVVARLFDEILTPAERCDVALRWRLLQMLAEGFPHRQVSRVLGVSPCKITRGSRILKKKDSVCGGILRPHDTRKRTKHV